MSIYIFGLSDGTEKKLTAVDIIQAVLVVKSSGIQENKIQKIQIVKQDMSGKSKSQPR